MTLSFGCWLRPVAEAIGLQATPSPAKAMQAALRQAEKGFLAPRASSRPGSAAPARAGSVALLGAKARGRQQQATPQRSGAKTGRRPAGRPRAGCLPLLRATLPLPLTLPTARRALLATPSPLTPPPPPPGTLRRSLGTATAREMRSPFDWLADAAAHAAAGRRSWANEQGTGPSFPRPCGRPQPMRCPRLSRPTCSRTGGTMPLPCGPTSRLLAWRQSCSTRLSGQLLPGPRLRGSQYPTRAGRSAPAPWASQRPRKQERRQRALNRRTNKQAVAARHGFQLPPVPRSP